MTKLEGNICPVDQSLKLFSKKWHIQIIRDLFFGKNRFKEFKEDKPDLSNKVLTSCLKDLESNGLIGKRTFEDNSKVTEYYLTDEGKRMNKIIYELAMFTLEKDDFPSDNKRDEIIHLFRTTLNIGNQDKKWKTS